MVRSHQTRSERPVYVQSVFRLVEGLCGTCRASSAARFGLFGAFEASRASSGKQQLELTRLRMDFERKPDAQNVRCG